MVKIKENLAYWLALQNLRDKIDVSTIPLIIKRFGSIEEFWQADMYEIIDVGWDIDTINSFFDYVNKARLSYYYELLYEIEESGTRIITYMDEEYPSQLKASSTSRHQPPIVLLVKGELSDCSNCAAIVGSRNASYHARKKAREFARELAELGYVIVSGLARGIDYEAHSGALDAANGRTIATLAWMDPIYPAEHKEFSTDIIKRGAIISEMYTRPRDSTNGRVYSRSRFVVRNRIISGLSNFIIAVESGPDGGTIRQAELALSQRKPVFTLVPKDTSNEDKIMGYNRLVKLGVKPVNDLEDLSRLKTYK